MHRLVGKTFSLRGISHKSSKSVPNSHASIGVKTEHRTSLQYINHEGYTCAPPATDTSTRDTSVLYTPETRKSPQKKTPEMEEGNKSFNKLRVKPTTAPKLQAPSLFCRRIDQSFVHTRKIHRTSE